MVTEILTPHKLLSIYLADHNRPPICLPGRVTELPPSAFYDWEEKATS